MRLISNWRWIIQHPRRFEYSYVRVQDNVHVLRLHACPIVSTELRPLLAFLVFSPFFSIPMSARWACRDNYAVIASKFMRSVKDTRRLYPSMINIINIEVIRWKVAIWLDLNYWNFCIFISLNHNIAMSSYFLRFPYTGPYRIMRSIILDHNFSLRKKLFLPATYFLIM